MTDQQTARAIDSHIHWFPPVYYEFLSRRATEPRAAFADGRWSYLNGGRTIRAMTPEWFDLDTQFETAARTGREMTLVSSGGVHSDLDGLPAAEAREAARMINEAWSTAQQAYPGRFFAAAMLPLVDPEAAIEEAEHAVKVLGLRALSLPSSIAGAPLDAPQLEDFYSCAERLGVPLFLHPIDSALLEAMSGYDYRLHSSLGRVCDSSMAVMRLILSGMLDRHPDLRILHFHAGGVLPYAAGRLDKNASIPGIEMQPTDYLRRMWVDTAMPHSLTIDLAVKFYGPERVLYGSDNPCWNPLAALQATEACHLEPMVMDAVMTDNAERFLDLRVPSAA
jgi:aminocarboxymuconate-semialdehyde decarboxylase